MALRSAPPKTPSPKAPPVDNAHIEEGSERFDDEHGVNEPTAGADARDAGKDATSDPTPEKAEDEVVVVAPKKRSLNDKIKDVEKRWGKDFDEVLIDLHDHVFGTSPPHDVVKEDPTEPANPFA